MNWISLRSDCNLSLPCRFRSLTGSWAVTEPTGSLSLFHPSSLRYISHGVLQPRLLLRLVLKVAGFPAEMELQKLPKRL